MILMVEKLEIASLFIMSKAHNGEISSRLFQQPTQNKVSCFIHIMLAGAGWKLLPFACFSFGCE